jgi:hypothetical protein
VVLAENMAVPILMTKAAFFVMCVLSLQVSLPEPGSEINGLTLGGVGAGTILENIQVSFGNDDAYEFFGGTVNAKNLIALATADDDYDFDFGIWWKNSICHFLPQAGVR